MDPAAVGMDGQEGREAGDKTDAEQESPPDAGEESLTTPFSPLKVPETVKEDAAEEEESGIPTLKTPGGEGRQPEPSSLVGVVSSQRQVKEEPEGAIEGGAKEFVVLPEGKKTPETTLAPQRIVAAADVPAGEDALSAHTEPVVVDASSGGNATRAEEVAIRGQNTGPAWDPESLPSLRCKVLLAGDTMMEDFALQLNRELRPRRGYSLQVVTRRSSCLSSSGRFNFAEKLDDAITEKQPDVVVLLLGCWDDVAIRTDEGYAMLGTPAWEEAYRTRVRDVLDVLQRQGVPAIWVGLPVMGSKNAQSLRRLTEITGECVSKSAVRFIDNQDVLADSEGKYQARESRPGREQVLLRRRDGKHTTRAGDELMVGRFLPVFSQVVGELVAARDAGGEKKVLPEDLPITDVHSQLFR